MTKNFKTLLVAALFCSAATVASAQGFYGKLGLGYAFPAGANYGTETSVNTDATTTKTTPFSLGAGFGVGLGVGYMFNQYIGVELAAGYSIGATQTLNKEDESTPGYTSSFTSEISSSGLTLLPAIKLVVPATDKLSVYSRLGIALPLVGSTVENREFTETSTIATHTQSAEIEYDSYFKLGYTGAIGVSFALTEKLDLFAELNGTISSFAVKKTTITKNTRDGVDLLPDMTTRAKETEYQKDYTVSHTAPLDNSKPDQESAYSLPSSNVGITIGVAFKF